MPGMSVTPQGVMTPVPSTEPTHAATEDEKKKGEEAVEKPE